MESEKTNGLANVRKITRVLDVRKLGASDLNAIISSGKPIFILNTSKPIVTMAINLPSKRGGSVQFYVPRTFIPIDISAQHSHNSIAESDDFKACLTKGVITLLDPDDALQYCKTEEAIKEHARIYKSAFAKGNASAAEIEKKKALEEAMEANHAKQLAESKKMKIDNSVNNNMGVSMAIISLCNQLNAKSVSIDDGLTELKILEGEMTAEDCSYVISNVVDGKIISHVRDNIYPQKMS